MKNFTFLFYFFLQINSFHSSAQTIQWMDSTDVANLKAGTFTYFNASAESSLILESKTDVFIDFATVDIPENCDSIVLTRGSKSISVSDLKPFLLKNADSSEVFSIVAFKEGKAQNFKTSGKQSISFKFKRLERPLLIEDEMVFGLLALVLAYIFYTSHKKSKFWQKFYLVIPALLLCYVIPAVLVFVGLISPAYSGLYEMARDYLLPAALILMTLGIDFKAIMNLGSKALIMFLTGTVGVILGGPIAILVYSWIDPTVVGGVGYEATWRGMATIAGSWIGGGANQNAMYETYKYAPQLYGKMIVVDIVVANLWMAFLLFGASRAEKMDKWLKADSSSIEELKKRVSTYQESIAKQPTVTDYMMILGIAFTLVGIGHFAGQLLAESCEKAFSAESPLASSFLWLVVIATTGGLLLSLTKLRQYEGAGASKIGSVFIYILVATIGMKMELAEAIKEPELILVGLIWMIVHVSFMLLVAKLIKAPFFFLAVGSQANIGGAASAPIVAAAFHPSLASVGAIIAVLGYALGTYGAIACAELMQWVSSWSL